MLFKLGKFSFELALAVKALDYGKSKVGVWVPSSIPDRYGLVKKKNCFLPSRHNPTFCRLNSLHFCRCASFPTKLSEKLFNN